MDSLKTIEVAIVDDHLVVHDGIRAMTERDPALSFVGGATNSEAALELVERCSPDVLLLDMRLGEESGFELCAKLRERCPGTAILMFSGFCNEELLTRAVRAGAGGYMLKDTDTSRLPAVVREFHERGSYFDPAVAGNLLVGILGAASQPGSRREDTALGDQDRRIIELIGAGATNYEIATELNLSSNTIKFHVTRLLRRFDVSRRSQLVKVAMEQQMLE